MPSVSPIKHSPVAKYLIENKAKAYKNPSEFCDVEFRNAENQVLGLLRKGENTLHGYKYINIDLYKPDEQIPFLSQNIIIEKLVKYFLPQRRFMPVKIEIEKTINDFEHNTIQKDTVTRGLASDRYIEKLKDSEELQAERKKLGDNVPDDYPVYKINKPFRYEFKAHLYYPQYSINKTKPTIKGK